MRALSWDVEGKEFNWQVCETALCPDRRCFFYSEGKLLISRRTTDAHHPVHRVSQTRWHAHTRVSRVRVSNMKIGGGHTVPSTRDSEPRMLPWPGFTGFRHRDHGWTIVEPTRCQHGKTGHVHIWVRSGRKQCRRIDMDRSGVDGHLRAKILVKIQPKVKKSLFSHIRV